MFPVSLEILKRLVLVSGISIAAKYDVGQGFCANYGQVVTPRVLESRQQSGQENCMKERIGRHKVGSLRAKGPYEGRRT